MAKPSIWPSSDGGTPAPARGRRYDARDPHGRRAHRGGRRTGKPRAGKRAAEHQTAERAERERKAAATRALYLDSLVGHEEPLGQEAAALVETSRPRDYDRAVALLRDLRDVSARQERVERSRPGSLTCANSTPGAAASSSASHTPGWAANRRPHRLMALPSYPRADPHGKRAPITMLPAGGMSSTSSVTILAASAGAGTPSVLRKTWGPTPQAPRIEPRSPEW